MANMRMRRKLARQFLDVLPGEVRTAYGVPVPLLASIPADAPEHDEVRQAARASLVQQGWLTETELDTLPLADAERLAIDRACEKLPLVAEARQARRRP